MTATTDGRSGGLASSAEVGPAAQAAQAGPDFTAEDRRFGRHATRPREIPLRGWGHILVRVFHAFLDNNTLLVAAGVTFYLLLSMVPALSAVVSIYGLFTDPAGVTAQLAFIQEYLPQGGQEILDEQLNRLVSQSQSSLGFALMASLLVALWSANAGMMALIKAMNVAYGEVEKRNFIIVTLISLAFTLGGILMLLALIVVILILPTVIAWVDLPGSAGFWVQFASSTALALALMAGLTALYRWGPSRERARWRWITPGAVVALVVGFLASTAFGWYVVSFGSYNRTYGSLGAIIGFLTWLWIMAAFIVTGAELNAEIEHQTARDSTVGPERPLGQRGAMAADRVAAGPTDIMSPVQPVQPSPDPKPWLAPPGR